MQLIRVFVFVYAKCRFSHDTELFMFYFWSFSIDSYSVFARISSGNVL